MWESVRASGCKAIDSGGLCVNASVGVGSVTILCFGA